jgi:hypothetical protein
LEFGIRNLEFGIEFGIWNLELRIRNEELGTRN